MNISESIKYIGVNDKEIDLFEGQYIVPNGMAYNSYLIIDEKIAVLDTVDGRFYQEWLDNLQNNLKNNNVDYLVVHHMEPDHSSCVAKFLSLYPDCKVVSSAKAFEMMKQFFGDSYDNRRVIVKEGDKLCLGKHELTFYTAPMVHWPEVIVSYEINTKTLFSADAFGKFGSLDVEEDWACEARRYYFGIVGKYGLQAQNLLKKASSLDIERICPLHGPVLDSNLGYYLDLYNTWTTYKPEVEGVFIAYTSVYGNTKKAVNILVDKLKAKGCPKIAVSDLAREDMAECVEDAFKYSKIILATTTYNGQLFPFMQTFIDALKERNYQNRTIGFIENGTWMPLAAKKMQEEFSTCKNIKMLENVVTIKSALSSENYNQLENLATEICQEYSNNSSEIMLDNSALFNIGYGLYVVTSRLNEKDNGFICNAVMQLTDTPNKVAVTISKENYSHYIIKETKQLTINCLSVNTPFKVFEDFGFKTGRAFDKFYGYNVIRNDSGNLVLVDYANSYITLKVENYVDLNTHGMFICLVLESKKLNDEETMSYSFYHKNVKPKQNVENKNGFICQICGFVYEGENIPEDYICPVCKHGAKDFEKI